VGAGPLPVDAHRRRPPIPIVPVDDGARAEAIARGAGQGAAWLAAISAASPAVPARALLVDADTAAVLGGPLAERRETPGMSVGEVALAVDAGRELAARAAADGVQILRAAAPAGRDDRAARAVAAALTGGSEHGPLGILRRLGDATTAVLCGFALGAGEHGLGCVCDDVTALAGAAVAAGIEPDLLPRLAVSPAAAAEPLAAHLGLPTVTP
jgi:nicotinate-nucleotide--dimethylbenzimidazole phosphoribosyltransferase